MVDYIRWMAHMDDIMTPTKLAQACSHCNKKKIKCKYTSGRNIACDSCVSLQIECIPRMRKRPRRKDESVADARGSVEGEQMSTRAKDGQLSLTQLLPSQTNIDQGDAIHLTDISNYAALQGVRHDLAGQRLSGQQQIPYNNTSSHVHAQQGLEDLPVVQSSEPRRYQQQILEQSGAESTTFIGRAHYMDEDTPIDERSARSYPISSEQKLSDTGSAVLARFKSFELPPRSTRQSLIDTFARYCQPWTPILSRGETDASDTRSPSILLMQALFLAASRVSSSPGVLSFASSEQFYQRAKALFYMNHEKDPLNVIKSTIMLQWYTPDGPEHISYDASEFWLKLGVGVAFQVGLHREPECGPNSCMRRRIWWSLVVRDALILVAHGRPRAINLKDSNVKPLCHEDFRDSMAKENADSFIPYVEICCLLGDLTEACARNELSRSKILHFESLLFRWPRVLPEHLHLSVKNINTDSYVLSGYNFNTRQLHLPYFVSLAIVGRRGSAAEVPSPQAILASSFVAGIFEEFLARDEIRHLAPIFTRYCIAAGFFLVSLRPYSGLWKAVQPDLEVLQLCLRELSNRWRSAVGGLKALQWVMNAKSNRGDVAQGLLWLTLEQQQFFKGFALDLCRLWTPYQEVCSAGAHDEAVGLVQQYNTDNDNEPSTYSDPSMAAIPRQPSMFTNAVDITDPMTADFQVEDMRDWFINEWGTWDIWETGQGDNGLL